MPHVEKVVVAYSGGVDSHVLLHVCAELKSKLSHLSFHSIHIDHGLQSDSSKWSAHCKIIAEGLNVNFSSCSVQASPLKGEGPEQAARHARYTALATFVTANTALLTAQHQDDQAETLLLQLLRGAGVKGLASMPSLIDFSDGYLARPFLNANKQSILDYANQEGLNWIEDNSNADISLDRNFLRQEVIPLIQQRWPAFAVTSSRSASHCAEAAVLLSDYAASFLSGDEVDLSLDSIIDQDEQTQRLIIRQWILNKDAKMPSTKVLQQLQQVISNDRTKSALIEWGDYQVRLYDGCFILDSRCAIEPLQAKQWIGENVLLNTSLGELLIKPVMGSGVSKQLWDSSDVLIGARQGGETIKLPDRRGNKRLKKLFNEEKIFPWVRDLIPLIYFNDHLVAVADLFFDEKYMAAKGEAGYQISWHHPELLIKLN